MGRIAERKTALGQRGACPMWTCPKCHSKVDASFDVCWNCGTTAEGVEDPTFVLADDVLPAGSPLDQDTPEGDGPMPSPDDSPVSDLVECYWASNAAEARMMADMLGEQGIHAMADTEDMHAEL